jgi:hypothetical protein
MIQEIPVIWTGLMQTIRMDTIPKHQLGNIQITGDLQKIHKISETSGTPQNMVVTARLGVMGLGLCTATLSGGDRKKEKCVPVNPVHKGRVLWVPIAQLVATIQLTVVLLFQMAMLHLVQLPPPYNDTGIRIAMENRGQNLVHLSMTGFGQLYKWWLVPETPG